MDARTLDESNDGVLVFDTNNNGKLDAGDARFGAFRVSVGGQLKTLAELGIVSIDLTATGSGQTFADGSAITGTSTFTRSDGTIGQAGDAKLAAEAQGYLITRSSTTAANGTITTTIEGRTRDGVLAYGRVGADTSQTIATTAADGSSTRLIRNFGVSGALVNTTQIVTAANSATSTARSVTTGLDQNGDGLFDEAQAYTRDAAGNSQTLTTKLAANGTFDTTHIVTAGNDNWDNFNVRFGAFGWKSCDGIRELRPFLKWSTTKEVA